MTLLSINEIDYSPWAVRGIKVDLQPIDNGELARDVNGTLVDLTLSQFRKHVVNISCTDHEAPMLVGTWRGMPLTITLISGMGSADDTDGPQVLSCLLNEWTVSRDEWESSSAWSLSALEV